MAIKIVGLIIGILILGVGVYYLAKEITDKESKRIYTITSVDGALIDVTSAALQFL